MAESGYDPDERFSLYPLTGEEVVRRVLDTEPTDDYEDDEDSEAPPDEPT
jgi:hypothetical protein